MATLDKAWEIASEAHKNDKWGTIPYIRHLSMVLFETFSMVEGEDMDVFFTAILHDVIEDHPEYSTQIEKDFPKIYDSLITLARKEDETYSDFIQRIIDSGDRCALIVKLADMRVNLYNDPPDKLLSRYEQNITKLEKAVINCK